MQFTEASQYLKINKVLIYFKNDFDDLVFVQKGSNIKKHPQNLKLCGTKHDNNTDGPSFGNN